MRVRKSSFAFPLGMVVIFMIESKPLELLVSLVADRPSDNRSNVPRRNAIISLNYDTLIEKAMRATGVLTYDYGSPEISCDLNVPQRAALSC